ncbi:MAG: beta-lactamase family protein [Nonomuraea sp.]|nr:beta-lactamase family protein [Nonomuraea sp.]
MTSALTRRTLLTASLAGIAAAGLTSPARASAREANQRIDEIVAAIRPPGIGVTVAVSRHGRTIFTKGYGLRDRGKPDVFTGQDFYQVQQLDQRLHLTRGSLPATAGTIYNLGSISKGFTAAAILRLHERGELSVNDPLGTFLPGYPRAAAITLLQLMQQVTGIVDYNQAPLFAPAYAAFVASGERDRSEVLAKLESLPLQFEPGTQWAYSNTNYLLLGLVVEEVTGMALGEYLERSFFRPLRLRDTRQGYPALGERDVALGYYAEADGVKRAYQWNLPWLLGAGGMTGTAPDLARWDAALLRPGLLRAETLELMFTPNLGGYACGWAVQTYDGRPFIWHNGGVGGFHTMHALFPDDGIAVVLLGNDQTTQPQLENSAKAVYDAIGEAG